MGNKLNNIMVMNQMRTINKTIKKSLLILAKILDSKMVQDLKQQE